MVSEGNPSGPGALPTFRHFIAFLISSLGGLLVSISSGFVAGSISTGSTGGGRLSCSPKCSAHLFCQLVAFVCEHWPIRVLHWFVCYLWFSCQPYDDVIHFFHFSFSAASSACCTRLSMYLLLSCLMLFFTSLWIPLELLILLVFNLFFIPFSLQFSLSSPNLPTLCVVLFCCLMFLQSHTPFQVSICSPQSLLYMFLSVKLAVTPLLPHACLPGVVICFGRRFGTLFWCPVPAAVLRWLVLIAPLLSAFNFNSNFPVTRWRTEAASAPLLDWHQGVTYGTYGWWPIWFSVTLSEDTQVTLWTLLWGKTISSMTMSLKAQKSLSPHPHPPSHSFRSEHGVCLGREKGDRRGSFLSGLATSSHRGRWDTSS